MQEITFYCCYKKNFINNFLPKKTFFRIKNYWFCFFLFFLSKIYIIAPYYTVSNAFLFHVHVDRLYLYQKLRKKTVNHIHIRFGVVGNHSKNVIPVRWRLFSDKFHLLVLLHFMFFMRTVKVIFSTILLLSMYVIKIESIQATTNRRWRLQPYIRVDWDLQVQEMEEHEHTYIIDVQLWIIMGLGCLNALFSFQSLTINEFRGVWWNCDFITGSVKK